MILWYANLGIKIYSYVQHVMKNKKGWTKLNCTPEIGVPALNYFGEPTNFPTLYVHELPSVEKGETLEGDTVAAVLSMIEIQAFSKTRDECMQLASDASECMKNLKYSATMIPLTEKMDGGYYKSVARYRRLVGSGDTDIVN